MSQHLTKSNLLKVPSLVCILQVGEVRTTSYVGTSIFLCDFLRWGHLAMIRMLAELCRLHGELFQHNIIFQQEHEASPHSNVVQVLLDY
jgi:hypothetical protein